MPIPCPTCSISNPDHSESCLRCGRVLREAGVTPDSKLAKRPSSNPSLSLPPKDSEPHPFSPNSSLNRTVIGESLRTDTPPPLQNQHGNRQPTEHSPAAPDPAGVTLRDKPVTGSPGTVYGFGIVHADETVEGTEAPYPIPPVSSPRLLVIRGERPNLEYPILAGKNYLGRTSDKPVDIDLESQEPVERIWTSRQHAVISLEAGLLVIEDLNSLNGTFVNRVRIHPAQQLVLNPGDVVQIGTVQMKVLV